jgi:hypothetical protein
MKKPRGVLFSIFRLGLLFFALPAWGAPLPDVLIVGADRWVADLPRDTALTATLEKGTKNLGQWQNRVYRRAEPISSVEVNLMEGEGFGVPYFPEGAVLSNDQLFPASPAYETLSVRGRRAILETDRLTGSAISVALDARLTLLTESVSLSPSELLIFTDYLIQSLLSLSEERP